MSGRILVTGGAGYIGSHCVLALAEKGCEITIFDNLSTGHAETVETLQRYGNINFIKGDLKTPEDIKSVFKNCQIDTVVHFAACALVEESVKDPQKYYQNNVKGTVNLLEAMLENNVMKIVFSSTAATYGEPEYTPIDEKHPQKPVNPYGRSKLIIEKILDDYNRAYDLKSVRLRYFNVAGADSKGRIGEIHNPETHLIPNILKSTLTDGKTFEMYGTDYKTKDGTCIRDYVNVEDLAAAHLLAIEYFNNGGNTDFFNLGTNEGNTVKEVFQTCKNVVGKEIPVKIMPRRAGDPVSLVADSSKAQKILGWKPSKNLEYSIKTAYEWERKQNAF